MTMNIPESPTTYHVCKNIFPFQLFSFSSLKLFWHGRLLKKQIFWWHKVRDISISENVELEICQFRTTWFLLIFNNLRTHNFRALFKQLIFLCDTNFWHLILIKLPFVGFIWDISEIRQRWKCSITIYKKNMTY